MEIKYKKLHPDAKCPIKAYDSDSCFDIFSIDDGTFNGKYGYVEYRTGISVEIPKGYGLAVRPRSSISKYDMILCNSPGTIDNAYRGEILVRYKHIGSSNFPSRTKYAKGDRIAQLWIEKVESDFVWQEVEDVSNTDRGNNGFGSTDSKCICDPNFMQGELGFIDVENPECKAHSNIPQKTLNGFN